MSIFIHRGGFKEYIKKCPITSLLILANTVMYLISVFIVDNYDSLGGLRPYLVKYFGSIIVYCDNVFTVLSYII